MLKKSLESTIDKFNNLAWVFNFKTYKIVELQIANVHAHGGIFNTKICWLYLIDNKLINHLKHITTYFRLAYINRMQPN